MRKIKLYIAASLNGKIAEKDGSVDWLYVKDNDEEIDYGYEKFYESIDTTIQGSSTYKQVESWGIDFPYPDKRKSMFNPSMMEAMNLQPFSFPRFELVNTENIPKVTSAQLFDAEAYLALG